MPKKFHVALGLGLGIALLAPQSFGRGKRVRLDQLAKGSLPKPQSLLSAPDKLPVGESFSDFSVSVSGPKVVEEIAAAEPVPPPRHRRFRKRRRRRRHRRRRNQRASRVTRSKNPGAANVSSKGRCLSAANVLSSFRTHSVSFKRGKRRVELVRSEQIKPSRSGGHEFVEELIWLDTETGGLKLTSRRAIPLARLTGAKSGKLQLFAFRTPAKKGAGEDKKFGRLNILVSGQSSPSVLSPSAMVRAGSCKLHFTSVDVDRAGQSSFRATISVQENGRIVSSGVGPKTRTTFTRRYMATVTTSKISVDPSPILAASMRPLTPVPRHIFVENSDGPVDLAAVVPPRPQQFKLGKSPLSGGVRASRGR